MLSRRPLITYGRRASDDRETLHKPPSPENLLLNTSTSDVLLKVSHPDFRMATVGSKAGLDLSELETSMARNILQTPYSGEGSGFEVFKLRSSRAAMLSPGHQFSLVPPVESKRFNTADTSSYRGEHRKQIMDPLRSKTSSRRLKENMKPKSYKNAHIITSGDESRIRLPLASPFTSRPVSPLKNPAVKTPLRSIAEPNQRSRPTPRQLHRQSLSDTRLHRSVSGAGFYGTDRHSVVEHDPDDVNLKNKTLLARTLPANLERRPSAPSLRPPPAISGFSSSTLINLNITGNAAGNNVGEVDLLRGTSLTMDRLVSYDFLFDSETYFLSSLDGTVDFNRPPSQMGAYDGEIDSDSSTGGLFKHIRGRSTPKFSRPITPYVLTTQPRSGNTEVVDAHAEVISTRTELKQYSSWISDSIIYPPTFYQQRQNHDIDVVELTLEDMELTQPISPVRDGAIGASSPDKFISAGSEARSPLRLRETKSLATTGLNAPLHDHESIETSTNSHQEENERIAISATKSQNRRIQGFARTRSGTVTQSKPGGGRTLGRRNRSGTIIQGGGGARRTRSGTVVQATREGRSGATREPRQSSTHHEDQPQENDKSQNICSCRSSDDELMLRSHSHHDLGAEDLEWKVAGPPSPVIKRLRRARRQHAVRRRKANGKKGIPEAVNAAGEDEWEDGTEGDIEDDELDLLGNFVPEDW